MKRWLLYAAPVVALAAFVACASKPGPKPLRPEFLERGVLIQLQADPMLNLYEGQPHTLLLCVYQLLDPNGFNQYREEYAGISKLLEGERFDPSVASVKRVFVQPGENQGLVLDRAEGAKFVGVVAGYYNMHKSQASRLFEVPLLEQKKGWMSQEITYRYGVLDLSLKLGPEEFHPTERTQGQ